MLGKVKRARAPGTWPFHDVEVNHRGFDRRMPHEVLNGSNVGPALEEMRGEGMSQRIITLLINSVWRGSPTGFIRFLAVKFR